MSHTSVDYGKKLLPRGIFSPALRRAQDRLYEHFAARFPPDHSLRVLDLGVNGALEDRSKYFFEYRYPFKERVVAAGLEAPTLFCSLYPEVPYIQVKRGAPLPFKDNEFDLVFCNAVIEHVGNRAAQRSFLADIVRVARTGFVTTPNRWYPVEFHTLLPIVHYLPAPIYRRLFRAAGFSFFAEEANLNLLDKDSLAALVPPGGITWDITTMKFLGLPSNLLLSFEKLA